MAEANKPEKLGFVRLYNTRLPLAAVEVQKPGALKGIGTMRHDISLVYVAHYCWEGGLLLVSQHIDDAPAGWLDREHTSPAMTSHVCATETAAVDRIVRMKGEAWENAHDRVEAAIGKNGLVSVTRYDADGVIQEDPEPEEHDVTLRGDPATEPRPDEITTTISVNGARAVPLTDKQFRDLPGKIRKLANGRQAVAHG